MKNMQRWLNSKGRDLEVAMFNTIGLNDEKINVLYAVSLFITDELGFAGVYNNDALPNIEETYYGLRALAICGFREESDSFYNEVVRGCFTYLFKQKDLKESDYYPALLAMGSVMLKKQNQNRKRCVTTLPRILHEYLSEEKPSIKKLQGLALASSLVDLDQNILDKLENDIYNSIEHDINKWDDKAILPLDIIKEPKLVSARMKDLVEENLNYILSKRLQSGVWFCENSSDVNMIKLSGVLTVDYLYILKNFNRI